MCREVSFTSSRQTIHELQEYLRENGARWREIPGTLRFSKTSPRLYARATADPTTCAKQPSITSNGNVVLSAAQSEKELRKPCIVIAPIPILRRLVSIELLESWRQDSVPSEQSSNTSRAQSIGSLSRCSSRGG
jgi:hypothetical protein